MSENLSLWQSYRRALLRPAGRPEQALLLAHHSLIPELPNDVALRELTCELQQFINWQGPLAPHFAYGSLTKAQYYSVHYLHLQSHLAEIS